MGTKFYILYKEGRLFGERQGHRWASIICKEGRCSGFEGGEPNLAIRVEKEMVE